MIKGNLYSVEFFYHLELSGSKEYYSEIEINDAISKAIDTSNLMK